MGMINFKAPALPLPTNQYDTNQQNQLLRALRLYFNNIDSLTPVQSEYFKGRGDQLVMPYGSFFSTSTQTAASTTVAYAITYSNTDVSNGVTLSNSSRLNVTYPGIYNIQFSVQLSNDTNNTVDIDVWLRKNGSNVSNTNSRFGLAPRKSAGDPYHTIGALNLFVQLDANDYVELYWRTTNTTAVIQYYAAGTSPTRPAVPSVITTVSFVSAI